MGSATLSLPPETPTITYDSGDVVYVSALTKLASISDVVNLVESVSLS